MRLASLAVLVVLGTAAPPRRSAAQVPLAPSAATGLSVTPAFEGWYRNADGTYSLSFGYFNRNTAQVLSIPTGPDNFISPGASNQGQPTSFYPRRHWGVFAVRVPADFGDKKVVWTIKSGDRTYAIPGSLREEWQIDALEGEAGSNNTPPALSFSDKGPAARGPGGISVSRTATVGAPITITVIAVDDGAGLTKGGYPVTLAWFTHQGPAPVAFSVPVVKLTPKGGTTTTTATFTTPGDYVLRVRATDSDVAAGGHSQCCWSNAFVNVRVTP
ncbi:MAG: hypothetical protein JWM41_1789 [Gemmatimonadetes bacterium]|nr:hypothetical protein [Gemmatimonadota bacterium]